jgi:hypothetical protein
MKPRLCVIGLHERLLFRQFTVNSISAAHWTLGRWSMVAAPLRLRPKEHGPTALRAECAGCP